MDQQRIQRMRQHFHYCIQLLLIDRQKLHSLHLLLNLQLVQHLFCSELNQIHLFLFQQQLQQQFLLKNLHLHLSQVHKQLQQLYLMVINLLVYGTERYCKHLFQFLILQLHLMIGLLQHNLNQLLKHLLRNPICLTGHLQI